MRFLKSGSSYRKDYVFTRTHGQTHTHTHTHTHIKNDMKTSNWVKKQEAGYSV